ncbi:MAG: YbhB/YbcL family Raf kinase inhibitor-like protein [Gammaproteobacteria bacterium]|nr:MAG: YbhB/YbcL family Raf kinase inhibitor-like protein [Gammaproteobacteria bacterium]
MLASPARADEPFRVASPAFVQGGRIPARYTCDGADVSPPLQWQGVPRGTRSLALLVEDPDAPDPAAPRTTWTHWILYDLPPDSRGLPEAVAPSALPPGTRQGRNDWRRTGYGGPCPPIGTHRYFFRLFALDVRLPEAGPLDRRGLLRAIRGHVLGEARLMGRYHR